MSMQLNTLEAVQDRSGPFRRVAIAFIILPTIATAVRFWSRAVAHKGHFGWDDWTCLLAWFLSLGLCIVSIIWSDYGLGRHIGTVNPEDQSTGLKLLYVGYFFFNIGLGIIKYSALFFYQRVFRSHDRGFNIAIYTGHALITAWLIFAVPSITFQCTPIHRLWNPTIPGHCLNTYAWYLASGIFDSLLDMYVLVLPMPKLYKLHIKPSRKWLIAGAFACGYCTILASLGRCISIAILGPAINADFTWNAREVLLWSFVEPPIGIISICLPSWFYLVRRLIQSGPGSLFTTRQFIEVSPARVVRGGPKTIKNAGGFLRFGRESQESESMVLQSVPKPEAGTPAYNIEHGIRPGEEHFDPRRY